MEETGGEGENHICSSAVREEVWSLYRRLLYVVCNGTCHSGRVLPRLFWCAPIRCVGDCGRKQGNGLAEEGLVVLPDWTKIDCSEA